MCRILYGIISWDRIVTVLAACLATSYSLPMCSSIGEPTKSMPYTTLLLRGDPHHFAAGVGEGED